MCDQSNTQILNFRLDKLKPSLAPKTPGAHVSNRGAVAINGSGTYRSPLAASLEPA